MLSTEDTVESRGPGYRGRGRRDGTQYGEKVKGRVLYKMKEKGLRGKESESEEPRVGNERSPLGEGRQEIWEHPEGLLAKSLDGQHSLTVQQDNW